MHKKVFLHGVWAALLDIDVFDLHLASLRSVNHKVVLTALFLGGTCVAGGGWAERKAK